MTLQDGNDSALTPTPRLAAQRRAGEGGEGERGLLKLGATAQIKTFHERVLPQFVMEAASRLWSIV